MGRRWWCANYFVETTRHITKHDIVQVCRELGPNFHPLARVDGLITDDKYTVRWLGVCYPQLVFPRVTDKSLQEWDESQDIIFVQGGLGFIHLPIEEDWRHRQRVKLFAALRKIGMVRKRRRLPTDAEKVKYEADNRFYTCEPFLSEKKTQLP
jgi:hypothetical protein